MIADYSKLLGSLGIAARARKLTFGTQLTCEAAQKGKLHLVILSNEASQNTIKKVKRCCADNDIALYPIKVEAEVIAKAVGKRRPIMTIGVTDANFKDLLQRTVSDATVTTAFLQTYSESEV